ncbi:MAG TPA: TonB-dependent receptor, partial [Candidatus Acidoferrales bacterium]|nr:TonB-dependent receptor [Candidatus Acidoferrales bacterium]
STDGAPVAGATIALRGSKTTMVAHSDARGMFRFQGASPGTYTLSAAAPHYTVLSGQTIAVRNGQITHLQLTLSREQASSLVVIGSVDSNGASTLSTASAPSVNINAQAYAAQAVTRVSDILADAPSTTVIPILGGGMNAPAVVALRGPDPSETLVDVDGHQINNGNTGDFDLSLLDPSVLQNVQVVYGIAPSSLFGPNTLGGAMNVVTLEPTTQPHALVRLAAGSYNTFGGTIDATGTDERFGYAFSLHRLTSGGQLNDDLFPNNYADSKTPTVITASPAPIGQELAATSTLAKLRYSFGNGGFVGIAFNGQSTYRDLSATLSSICPIGNCQLENGSPNPVPLYSNLSGSSLSSTNSDYDFDLSLPLGSRAADGSPLTTAILRHQTALLLQSVAGPAAGSSPYLYNDRDLIADDTLEFQHQLPKGTLSLKLAITDESLVTDNIPGVIYADAIPAPPPQDDNDLEPFDGTASAGASETVQHLAQTQRWAGLRYTLDTTPHLHYSVTTYYSNFSSFGHSFDPRVGFVWTPTADSALRASAGNTFQSPQLPTFLVPSPTTPIPVVGGYASIGNPNATAERSTEYDIGYEHLFHLTGHPLHLALDVYRTNLHNGVANYVAPVTCSQQTVTLQQIKEGVVPACLTYPENVTHEVYEGVELTGDLSLSLHTTLRGFYDINSAYIATYPGTAADNAVPYEQDLGVPLHKVGLTLQHDAPRWSYYAGVLYEGLYNELNLGPFATLRAGATLHVKGFDVGLYGENLTNAFAFANSGFPYPVTITGGGILYGGLPGSPADGLGPVPTDAYTLPARRVTLVLTRSI